MRALIDLMLPARCAGCGCPGTVGCPGCLEPLAAPPRCAWPSPTPAGLPIPYSVAGYDGSVRAFLLAYKEEGVVALRRPLGRALAAAVAAACPAGAGAAVRLVPVPSTPAARRQRGDDVVRRLAGLAARELRRVGTDAAVVPALVHRHRVADSAGLTARERADNLAGAFAVRAAVSARLQGTRVVLVDDLITTGATLAECAAALRQAGVPVQAAATVAATRRLRATLG